MVFTITLKKSSFIKDNYSDYQYFQKRKSNHTLNYRNNLTVGSHVCNCGAETKKQD